MSYYPSRDAILDRHRSPTLTIMWEVYGEYLDGHQLQRRKYRTKDEALEARNRILTDYCYGYKVNGQWRDSALIRCECRQVEVPTFFK